MGAKRTSTTGKKAKAAGRTVAERALSYIRVSGRSLESLGSGIAEGGLQSRDLDGLAELIARSDYDPLILGLPARVTPDEVARAGLVADARAGLRRIAAEGAKAELSGEQQTALEAIVRLTGRPSFLIRNGTLQNLSETWHARLLGILQHSKQVIGPVGRIEVTGYPELSYLGTGFLVAPTVIMTNRHVAEVFSHKKGNQWRIKDGMTARIDFKEEYGSAEVAEFPITEAIGAHDKFDLALFTVGRKGSQGVKLPGPLKITQNAAFAAQGSEVITIGYPAADPRNDATQQHRIFKGIFEKKRVAPGRVMEVKAGILTHDCTTLGGNSGSSVIHVQSRMVVGLHFGGRYLEENEAVLLPAMTKDPLLRRAGIAFH